MVKRFSIQTQKIVPAEQAGEIFVYINPDDGDRKFLLDTLKIDEHTMQSALDPNEIGRMEFEPDHVAFIVKRPKRYNAKDNFLFKVESICLFNWSENLVKIMYRSASHFEEHIKVISLISDELEQQINKSVSNRQLLNMFTLEKSLVFYLDGISSNKRVIEKIKATSAKLSLSTLNIEFLDDLAIENSQCHEMAQVYSQVISGLMDARASVISNNLNVMMKNLNAIVIAVAIPSFFAGIGGMSEFSAMIGFSHWKIGYPIFIGSMMAIGLGTFFIIKKVEQIWKND